MKFLLVAVNAKYIHSNPAVYSLRAFAGKDLQPYIDLAEYTINNRMQDILADIYKRKPDVIGFSCYIWNWSLIQDLFAEVKKILPQTDIWLGGPEVTYDAPEILQKYPFLKGIMLGEGEATFRELLEYYLKRETKKEETKEFMLSQISGLCLTSGYTANRELMDMNTLPFLYQDLKPFSNKVIYYETSRGCPYRCSYCLSSVDKKVRLRDISIVKKELQFFLDNQVKQVKFVDRTFNCNHEHAMAIWQYLSEHDNGITNFHFEISADILREDEIALLRKFRPGLAQLEIGVQSVNPKTIQAIQRVMNVETLEDIVSEIQKGRNIHQHLDLIAGLPWENYESFRYSFNRVYGMRPQQLQLGFLKVLKGSPMHEKAKEYGICYLEKPPYEVLYTKWLSYEEILKLKAVEEMVELYYNSNQFTYTLPFLEGAFSDAFTMYEKMAEFYEENGYFVNSPARAYRYDVLLSFAKKYDKEFVDIYKELLTYDMYLRENLKSRPDFSKDLTEKAVKDVIREFYQKEESERKYLPDYQLYDWKQLAKMTHLEPFAYPVWNVQEICGYRFFNKKKSVETERYYILFDYKKRNALTYEADTKVVMKR